MIPQIVGAKYRHTRDRKNLDKAISFDQKGTNMYSLQLSRHSCTKWLTVASPYSLTQLYLPLTWDLSRSEIHSLPQLAKSLGGWVRAQIGGQFSQTMELYKNPEEETGTLQISQVT
jgi:hypothetical protein